MVEDYNLGKTDGSMVILSPQHAAVNCVTAFREDWTLPAILMGLDLSALWLQKLIPLPQILLEATFTNWLLPCSFTFISMATCVTV